jgi:hypothetical protein
MKVIKCESVATTNTNPGNSSVIVTLTLARHNSAPPADNPLTDEMSDAIADWINAGIDA